MLITQILKFQSWHPPGVARGFTRANLTPSTTDRKMNTDTIPDFMTTLKDFGVGMTPSRATVIKNIYNYYIYTWSAMALTCRVLKAMIYFL